MNEGGREESGDGQKPLRIYSACRAGALCGNVGVAIYLSPMLTFECPATSRADVGAAEEATSAPGAPNLAPQARQSIRLWLRVPVRYGEYDFVFVPRGGWTLEARGEMERDARAIRLDGHGTGRKADPSELLPGSSVFVVVPRCRGLTQQQTLLCRWFRIICEPARYRWDQKGLADRRENEPMGFENRPDSECARRGRPAADTSNAS